MRAIFLVLVCTLAGCQSVPPQTILSPAHPPAQAQLDAQYQEQLAAFEAAMAMFKAKLSAISASSFAIGYVGLPNISDCSGKGVVVRENEVIAANAGEPTPADRAAALERANAQLRGQVAEANKLYGEASTAAAVASAALSAKTAEIVRLTESIATLRQQAEAERAALTAQYQAQLDAKDKALSDLRDAQAKRERRLWVNCLRIAGLALVVIGIGLVALTKGLMIAQGGILALGGALIVGIGMAFDIVARQPWFPWVAGLLGVVVVASGVWAILHFYKQGTLNARLAGVVNDLKTEADSGLEKSAAAWDALQPHLEYRLGQLDSSARKELSKLMVKLGLDSDTKS